MQPAVFRFLLGRRSTGGKEQHEFLAAPVHASLPQPLHGGGNLGSKVQMGAFGLV